MKLLESLRVCKAINFNVLKTIHLAFCLVFVCCSKKEVSFENYNELEIKGMLSFKENDFENSLNNLEKAINIKPHEDSSIYFYATAAALNLNKENKAKELLIKSIQNTNVSKDYFQSFEEFDLFRHKELFLEIERDYQTHVSEFYKNLEHPRIYREIDSLVELDQEYRNNGSDWEEISRIDSVNVNRLIEITKKYGWQKKGWIILWHQRDTYGEDNEVWNFFKPYINEQIKKGKIKKDFWAIFDEEKSIIKDKKQIYGFYWNQFDQYPIADVKNVDKRRAKVGLPPLWYLKKVYEIELPKGYKECNN